MGHRPAQRVVRRNIRASARRGVGGTALRGSRSAYYSLSGRPAWWALLAGGLAVAAVLGLTGFMMINARRDACSAAGDEIISAQQVTAEEGTAPSPPPGLVSQADKFAACGGGELIMIRGAGQGGVQAGPAVSLRVYREPGEVENDPTARQNKVQSLITRAFEAAQASRPPGAGRDVIGLLASVSSELGPGTNDVWLQTLGLPTVNPADARLLMAADPAQAVASIARWIPSLRGARVHLILSPPAGNQPRFNTATDAWRREFMVALLRQAGADVASVIEVESVEPPVPGAPPAPVIPNLPEPTPRLPPPRLGHTYIARLDSSTLFVPNSAQFLTSTAQVMAQLQPIITGWRLGLFSHVLVVGHCARFGPPTGALLLSQQRAAEVARLLRLGGVTAVTAKGVGYDQPLPPNPQSANNRVVIVTAYPKT
jgi:outer membrane protein OmpA-like peptidoglycan-associated protein